MQETIERILNIAKIIVLAAIVGIIVGAICALFGRGLLALTYFRWNHSVELIPFLGIAGVFICMCYQRWGGDCIRGMTLVFEAEFGERKDIPFRMIPFVILATWITHLFGGSAGREGVAVQIGATVGFRIGKFFRDFHAARILLIAGMTAGFAGLFRTPLAAVFFSLEVLVAGQLSYEALVPTIVAALAASATSSHLGMIKESVPLICSIPYTPIIAVKLVIIALIFGFTGQLFSISLNKLREFLPKLIKNPCIRIFVFGAGISLLSLLLFKGRYSGLGLNLTSHVYSGGGDVFAFDWLLKLIFTVVTLGCGFQGGELTPLFCIGTTLGFVLAPILNLPPLFCAALGYAAVFGSATNTLLAPAVIACEVFGFQYMPFFFFVCAIAYAFNGNRTIYPRQKILHFNHSIQEIKTS